MASKQWFAGLDTEGQVKAVYRSLAKQYHPDLAGKAFTATMQDINAQYHAKLESLDGQTRIGSDGKEHTYRYTYEREQAVVDQLSKLDAEDLPGIEIEIIGSWIWITGDTKPVKDKLKELGCFWHSKRKCWYWRSKGSYSRYTGASFATLRAMYGSEVHVRDDDRKQPRAAQPALIGA